MTYYNNLHPPAQLARPTCKTRPGSPRWAAHLADLENLHDQAARQRLTPLTAILGELIADHRQLEGARHGR